jgi:hypothetical protein
MRNGKVFFNPIEGSAPLSISWSTGPKGDAVEANNESGVGFFSEKGDLLAVIFDDVEEKKIIKFWSLTAIGWKFQSIAVKSLTHSRLSVLQKKYGLRKRKLKTRLNFKTPVALDGGVFRQGGKLGQS